MSNESAIHLAPSSVHITVEQEDKAEKALANIRDTIFKQHSKHTIMFSHRGLFVCILPKPPLYLCDFHLDIVRTMLEGTFIATVPNYMSKLDPQKARKCIDLTTIDVLGAYNQMKKCGARIDQIDHLGRMVEKVFEVRHVRSQTLNL